MKAWLHRRGKPSWQFDWCESRERFIHRSRRRTLYAIFSDAPHKPFWIGRLAMNESNRACWITVEDRLCAHSIEFDDAGVYTFPKGLK
jgi:hypothetical protein